MRKDTKEFIRWATERGWTVSRTKNGHLRIDRPGHQTVHTSSTPSDARAFKNAKAIIQRFEREAEAQEEQS